jgi:hypothetical protein
MNQCRTWIAHERGYHLQNMADLRISNQVEAIRQENGRLRRRRLVRSW